MVYWMLFRPGIKAEARVSLRSDRRANAMMRFGKGQGRDGHLTHRSQDLSGKA